MIQTKERKIFYSRATWGLEDTLENSLRIAFSKLKLRRQRAFAVKDYELQGMHRSLRDHAIFMDVSKVYPDQDTGLVPKPADEEDAKVGVQQPPSRFDFLNGEVFIMIIGNNVLSIPNEGATEYAGYEFMRRMLSNAGMGERATQVDFQKVANVSQLQMLRAEGAKSIRLHTTISEAEDLRSKSLLADQSIFGIASKAAGAVKDMFRQSMNSDSAKYGMANLTLDLNFKWKGRGIGEAEARHITENIAEATVAEGHDGFTILTSKGNTITQDSIRLHKPVTLKANGNSVQRADAYVRLQEYYIELSASNSIL
jgi:hypothetical protein